jgi:predicted RND superfamily exporter protein
VNLIAAGIAVFGCGTLVWSEYPPLHGLGVISVVTLITCLAASVFVLPACLARRTR